MDLLLISAICSASLGLNCILLTRQFAPLTLWRVAKFSVATLLSGLMLVVSLLDSGAPQFAHLRTWVNQQAVFTPLMILVLILLLLNIVAFFAMLLLPRVHKQPTAGVALEVAAVSLPIYLFCQVIFSN